LAIGTVTTSCSPTTFAPLFGAGGCKRHVESFEDNGNNMYLISSLFIQLVQSILANKQKKFQKRKEINEEKNTQKISK
jgi:hypothetical protein